MASEKSGKFLLIVPYESLRIFDISIVNYINIILLLSVAGGVRKGMEHQFSKMVALGRPFRLAELYNYCLDNILTGIKTTLVYIIGHFEIFYDALLIRCFYFD